MPRKTQIVQNDAPILTQEEASDDELKLKPVTNPSKTKAIPIPTDTVSDSIHTNTKFVKTKRPYTCTEEHKEVLRQRLAVATQRKQELANERLQVKEQQMNALEMKKQAKILEEAEKLKRKEDKMLKQIEVKPQVKQVAPKPKQKKKVVVYISDSDDDDEAEEEEEIVVKPKRKQAVQRRQPVQYAPPSQQPINPYSGRLYRENVIVYLGIIWIAEMPKTSTPIPNFSSPKTTFFLLLIFFLLLRLESLE